MGLRALARRSRGASMTVLGDLAQATAPGAQESWEAAIAALGRPALAQRADLDLGYRVPGIDHGRGQRAAAEAAPDVTPTRSVRIGGRPPAVVAVGDDAAIGPEVGAATADLAAEYASVAIVVPPGLRHEVDAALADLPESDRARVTTLDPPEAKGLEFDAVVVVEPAVIGGGTSRGLRLLYVALTRAVQELVVVHRLPLPAGLDLDLD